MSKPKIENRPFQRLNFEIFGTLSEIFGKILGNFHQIFVDFSQILINFHQILIKFWSKFSKIVTLWEGGFSNLVILGPFEGLTYEFAPLLGTLEVWKRVPLWLVHTRHLFCLSAPPPGTTNTIYTIRELSKNDIKDFKNKHT